jgi:hypothetical protein
MGYMTALICLNGHIITGDLEHCLEDNKKYCNECGATTIKNCQHCGQKIDGDADYGYGFWSFG